jgi:hypothetical protein
MKYLKRFNESESLSNYSHYDDVIDLLEEIKYMLEVSQDYNVDISYKFDDFTCIINIKPIGWDIKIHSKDGKKEILDSDIDKIEEMVRPYLTKELKNNYNQSPITEIYDKYNNILKLRINFNIFCKKCENKDLVCNSCNGSGNITCGCDDGVERCYNCHGTELDCLRCEGDGVITCEWCNGSGGIECNYCYGSGNSECNHQWL